MQLRIALLVSAAALFCSAERMALGDGDVTMTGAYYKEYSTRVVQPMMDARLDAGERGEITGHVLVDSITSASPATGAIGAAFTEKRYEFGAGYSHTLGDARVGASVRFSDEPDYRSIFGTVRGQLELAQRNTILAASISSGHDALTNANAQGGIDQSLDVELNTVMTSIGVTQVLSPLMVAGLTYDFSYLDGYQANLYRLVIAGGIVEPERLPERRYRNAIFASVRRFLPASRSTVVGGFRLYVDDWGIVGGTPELRLIQEIVPDFSIRLRYRFHRQSAADFYEKIYDTGDSVSEPYLTADEKLSDLYTQTAGVKFSLSLGVLGVAGRWAKARTDASVEYVVQSTSFGNATVAQLGFTVPFSY